MRAKSLECISAIFEILGYLEYEQQAFGSLLLDNWLSVAQTLLHKH